MQIWVSSLVWLSKKKKKKDSTCSSITNKSSSLFSIGPGHVRGPVLSTLHVLTPSVFTTISQGSSFYTETGTGAPEGLKSCLELQQPECDDDMEERLLSSPLTLPTPSLGFSKCVWKSKVGECRVHKTPGIVYMVGSPCAKSVHLEISVTWERSMPTLRTDSESAFLINRLEWFWLLVALWRCSRNTSRSVFHGSPRPASLRYFGYWGIKDLSQSLRRRN